MLDPIVNFFTRIFQWIGRGIGFVIGILLWPFLWAGRWYVAARLDPEGGRRRSRLLVLVGLYAYFFCAHAGLDGTSIPTTSTPTASQSRNVSAGEQVTAGAGTDTATHLRHARPSPTVTADLIDFNVNQNAWISSMILYKLGLFGIDWDHTPFLDNKASFQRGINQAMRRTTTELVDKLGRVRSTSQIDDDLQDARGNIAVRRGDLVFRPAARSARRRRRRAYYRDAITKLRAFNDRLRKLRGGLRRARRQSEAVSSTASPATSARPRRSSRTAPRTTMSAGSTRAPTTASGSPTASSTPITAC